MNMKESIEKLEVIKGVISSKAEGLKALAEKQRLQNFEFSGVTLAETTGNYLVLEENDTVVFELKNKIADEYIIDGVNIEIKYNGEYGEVPFEHSAKITMDTLSQTIVKTINKNLGE